LERQKAERKKEKKVMDINSFGLDKKKYMSKALRGRELVLWACGIL
jgi:hypothetical protein